jgi:hypothetical protein
MRLGKGQWTKLDTDRKIRKIKNHWELGSSALQIAQRVGNEIGETVSRNAIIGVYTRNAEQLADYPLRRAFSGGNRTTGARREQARKPRAPSVRAPASYHAKVKIAEPVEVEIPEPSPKRLPLADLDKGQCRWPVNDASVHERHLFCGTSTAGPGKPYCPYHMARSIGEGTKSEREAVKVRVDA